MPTVTVLTFRLYFSFCGVSLTILKVLERKTVAPYLVGRVPLSLLYISPSILFFKANSKVYSKGFTRRVLYNPKDIMRNSLYFIIYKDKT